MNLDGIDKKHSVVLAYCTYIGHLAVLTKQNADTHNDDYAENKNVDKDDEDDSKADMWYMDSHLAVK